MNHLIIESDNLPVLKGLFKNFKGKIDVMPIDPPYDTNIQGIGYQDSDYPGGWVSFMRPRLETAYQLLSPKGVMFIHVDENELVNLMMLCGKIFGSQNMITMVWKKTNPRFDRNRKEKPLESGIRRVHEYILVCFKDKKSTTLNRIHQPVWDGHKYVETECPLETVVDDLGTTSSAKDELEELFGDRKIFSTPKPVRMIQEFIRSAGNRNSIILDFFAGSGTTGQAVLELNREDHGNRKFILVTNRENDICRKVTIPRIKLAMQKNHYEECVDVILEDGTKTEPFLSEDENFRIE